ncbi:glycosyltransferase [Sulfuricella sp.]|uniref:glycosyltransferase n=1 Tax=Sulfuricella sp. TaxID=2099377 RepID=UPI002BAB6E75|nr:glycosyltransferase [Sulfuricella sp.]HUX65320.1 glycosyltransferase [Sulfuricella sp.]
MKLTFAFCTYNRSDRLENLVAAMRAQDCPIPFEILAVNNNSKDNTLAILENLAARPGVSLRFVTETEQGIVPARNRAIEEALESDILVFMDDDELPQAGLLNAAHDAIVNEGAECVGGRVEVDFTPHGRPTWLEDDLLGFLAEVKHGDTPFWITDDRTPVWTANIAYDMRLFRDHPALRFDKRYNREGSGMGGGEDAILFRTLLARGTKIRYRPDMAVWHFIEPWRLKRSYFLKLHYRAGLRVGRHELPAYPRILFGIPPFLVTQCVQQSLKVLGMYLTGQPGALRQAMNATHAMGCLVGFRYRS